MISLLRASRDPVSAEIALLTKLLIFLVFCLFVSEAFFSSDGQFFQAIFSLASAISGALIMLVRQNSKASQPRPSEVPVTPPAPQ